MREAHPRVGGENDLDVATAVAFTGSSPRGRGKHLLIRGALPVGGLIPAWAGKTFPDDCVHVGVTAHPRVGGENPPKVLIGVDLFGSSPRGRGKRATALAVLADDGLIPAWAGKTG